MELVTEILPMISKIQNMGHSTSPSLPSGTDAKESILPTDLLADDFSSFGTVKAGHQQELSARDDISQSAFEPMDDDEVHPRVTGSSDEESAPVDDAELQADEIEDWD